MTIPYYNILDVSQKISLRIIRQRHNDGLVGAIINIYILGVALMFLVLTIMMFFFYDVDVDILVKAAESITTMSQTFIKLLPLLIYRDSLRDLFDSMKLFWDPENYPELLPSIKKIYKDSYYFLFGYLIMLCLTVLLFCVFPIIQKTLLMQCYIPESVPYAFQILLGMQYQLAVTIPSAMIGFDTMYAAFLTHLVVQLKCLNYAMENIDMQSPDFKEILKKIVDHHRFILNFADELSKIFGVPLLGQYLISTFLTCAELYLFSENFGSPIRLVSSFLYTTSLLVQFACYCFSASEFTTQANLLADGTYMSKWYEGTPAQQKMMGFVIQRAQKEVFFTAAGLVIIDKRAFIAVFKAAVSFYTFMKNFKAAE